MLRGLPEDSTFTAHMRVEQDRERQEGDAPTAQDIDPELSKLIDKKTWTEDRKLMADISNRLGLILLYLHPWEKGKEPKLPTIGPDEWREDQAPKVPKSLDDVLAMFTNRPT